ncbi:16S rRNA (cytosine(1402)-N(4))-methyltransferase RsmH [Allorhodopirellula solitaria]|uniref:Ribosomal RNA small subunit methyltransferase H n=1 Tax=Allorhodopirellula solitaria TaxID=2527987 RepID=A0A5C5YHG4_9BACT|nr:16S rRNA (cytosine(1402)-N(4))-methyltransferase RsmH [Allorhodopirellula solitaria]TWT74161.1 Ribosomal RNA small subunit methyltransferase H [Allorhodopirellula solitaria]
MNESIEHVSVMPDEIVAWVGEAHPRTIVDGTYGGGGHTRLLLDVLPKATTGDDPAPLIIGMDRDPAVLARDDVPGGPGSDPRIELFLGSYEKSPAALAHCERSHADALVLDLGLSSDQLVDRERGFSFTMEDAELDLRFDPESDIPAYEWLAYRGEREIADTIYQFGEERYSRRIARSICLRAQDRNPVRTVGDLVEICRRCVPRSKNHDIHPATRTFQALRIAVNDELNILQRTLASAADWISPGGRIAAISFHSLEDRIVKNAFREDERWKVLTKKPLRPTDQEIRENPRSRSAKLRVAERLGSEDTPG